MDKFRQKFPWLFRRIAIDYLLIAVIETLFLLQFLMIVFFEGDPSIIFFELMLFPLLPTYWLQYHLSSRINKATQLERRMDLAVTLLPAREYLIALVKKPVIITCYIFTVPFVSVVLLVLMNCRSYEAVSIALFSILVASVYGLILAYISLAGLFDLAYWRSKDTEFSFSIGILLTMIYRFGSPIPAVIITLIIPAIVALLVFGCVILLIVMNNIFWIWDASYYSLAGIIEFPVPFLLLFLGLILSPIFIISCWNVWRKTKAPRRVLKWLARTYGILFILHGISIGMALMINFNMNYYVDFAGMRLYEKERAILLIFLVSLMCYSPVGVIYAQRLLRRSIDRACRVYYKFE